MPGLNERFWRLHLGWRLGLAAGLVVTIWIIAVAAYPDRDKQERAVNQSRPTMSAVRPLPVPLEEQVTLSDLSCYVDGSASGRVTNKSRSTVQVFIAVQILDRSGIVIDDSLDTVRGLRPGETGEWEVSSYIGDRGDRCRAEISSVFAD